VIVDASALLAIAFAEPDADAMLDVLTRERDVRIPASAWLEASMVIDRRGDPAAPAIFAGILQRLAITVAPLTAEHAVRARAAWAKFGRGRHRARLNFGDCMVYAVAAAEGETLLFKGDDFIHTDIEPALKP
jgi:ribonuclease VapC